MQNEELAFAKEQAENAMEKYTDLYNFAPAGYLTLSKEGEIIELNFSAANLLGIDRLKLKSTRLGLYITEDTLETYNIFLSEVFSSNTKETCEILLKIKGDNTKFVHIEAIVLRDSSQCLLAMTDITEHKMLEDELYTKSKELKTFNNYFIGREFRMIELKKEINELLSKSGMGKKYSD
jgi:PAS domain S-box-containing protein